LYPTRIRAKIMKISRYLLPLILLLVFVSCKKEEQTNEEPSAPQYYTFIGEGDWEGTEIRCYEFNSNNRQVANHSFDYQDDTPVQFTADKDAAMVKVMCRFYVDGDLVVNWIKEIFYLKPNENINIYCTPTTYYTDSEPQPEK